VDCCPSGVSAAGATLRSENGVPVVASISTLLRPDVADPSVTGYTSQLGWPEPDTSWVVPGEAPGTRQQVIHVVNPGADTAVVDVALWNGAVLSRPAGLQGVEVGPGRLVEFLVSDAVSDATHMVAYVTRQRRRWSPAGTASEAARSSGSPTRVSRRPCGPAVRSSRRSTTTRTCWSDWAPSVDQDDDDDTSDP
jgi:hypothetical protein